GDGLSRQGHSAAPKRGRYRPRERLTVEVEVLGQEPDVVEVLVPRVDGAERHHRLKLLGDDAFTRVRAEVGRREARKHRRQADRLGRRHDDIAKADIELHCDARLAESDNEPNPDAFVLLALTDAVANDACRIEGEAVWLDRLPADLSDDSDECLDG